MARRPEIELFCEDSGHESFARAMVYRIARERSVPQPFLRSRSARGGHGRAVSELRQWQRSLQAPASAMVPDLLLVLIDANGEGADQRRLVEAAIAPGLIPSVIVACPDPHVEAWCAADPEALRRLTGAQPPARPNRPGRGVFKRWLREALEAAGEEIDTDPMDISADLVPEMDLYRAAMADASLGRFIEDLRAFMAPFAPV